MMVSLPMRFLLSLGLLCAVVAAAVAQPAVKSAEPVDPDHAAKMARSAELFRKDVAPILTQRCLRCHGGKKTESEFDLADRDSLLRGGKAGPAVLPGRGNVSLLVQLVRHQKEPAMPESGEPLSAEQVGKLVQWIDLGAAYDEPLVKRPADAAKAWTTRKTPDAARDFWAYRPLRRAEPPAVRDAGNWARTPIDRFVLAKMEEAGVSPSPPVDRARLMRRVCFDLLGLPPTPEQLDAFLNDPSPDAYAKMIDRLLESPHFGERWARHWLDLARFAESHGFEHDYDRPTAYTYRDFVIKALNQDLPYDTFVKWQLAGDEYAPDDPLANMATGFLAAGVHSTQITKSEVEKHRYDEMDDMLATVGTSMLGLTFGCARCHDHKYDPVPQADYYRMLATFTTTVRSEQELIHDAARYREAKAAFDAKMKPFLDARTAYEKQELPGRLTRWERERPVRLLGGRLAGPVAALAVAWTPKDVTPVVNLPAAKRKPPQQQALMTWFRQLDPAWVALDRPVRELEKQAPPKDAIKALISSEGVPAVRLHTQGGDFLPETHFLRRGDANLKEGVATQGFLQVLMTAPDGEKHWQTPPPAGWRTSYRRRAMAEWLTDVEYGAGRLLARVIVNRLWQHHMGRGIVATVSNFGERGDRPTHPELLDWLATELIRQGWRLKPIHKLILTSAVYQQGVKDDPAAVARDPDNRLWWRRETTRLEAEVIRDAILSVSGTLDPTQFGRGTLDPNSRRRSIYFTVKRSKLVPMMLIFDAPDALTPLAERPTTTVAPQALLLMNNEQVRAASRAFAQRIESGSDPAAAVERAYVRALARPPLADERADALAFVEQQRASYREAGKKDADLLAWTDFCQVLLCLNEFVYVE